jgi:hypothetical protein
MQDLLAQIKAREVAQLAEAETKFRKLAVEVATGAVVDTDEIVCRLSDAGKTANQLVEAMEKYQQRVNNRADIDAAADAETGLVAQRELAAKSDAAWQVIWDQRQNDISRLNGEMNRLAGIVSTGNSARRSMDDSVGSHIAAMQVELKKQMAIVAAETNELSRQLKDHESSYEQSLSLQRDNQLSREACEALAGSLERLEARRTAILAKQAEFAALDARYKQLLDVDVLDPVNF